MGDVAGYSLHFLKAKCNSMQTEALNKG